MDIAKDDIILKVRNDKKNTFLKTYSFLDAQFEQWKSGKTVISIDEAKRVADLFEVITYCFEDPTTYSVGSGKSNEELESLISSMILKFTKSKDKSIRSYKFDYSFKSKKQVQDIPLEDGSENWSWLFKTFNEMVADIVKSVNFEVENGYISIISSENGRDFSKQIFIQSVYGLIDRYVERNIGGDSYKKMTFYKKSVLTSFIAHSYGFRMSKRDTDMVAKDFTCMELHGHVKYYLKKYKSN